jgi:hypothetical protein
MAAVGGCCLCVGLLSAFSDPSWFKQLPHLTLQPMIHSLGVTILACSSTSSKHRFYKPLLAISNPTYFVTNCIYGHFIFLLPFRSYTMAEWQNISISHAGYIYAIFICHFPKLLHVSFKPLHLELSFRCTTLPSVLAHHLFFIKFFHHYSYGTSSRVIQLGKIFYYFLVNMDSIWLDTFPSVGDSRKCCNRPLIPDICNKRNLRSITPGIPIHTCYRSMAAL